MHSTGTISVVFRSIMILGFKMLAKGLGKARRGIRDPLTYIFVDIEPFFLFSLSFFLPDMFYGPS